MDRRPAVLGYRPMFESEVPIVQPTLPDIDEVTDVFRSVLTSGMLTGGTVPARFRGGGG